MYPMISGPFTAIKEEVPASSAGGIQISMCRPHLLELVREEVEYAQGPVSVNGERYSLFRFSSSRITSKWTDVSASRNSIWSPFVYQ